jgi:hypothetical protein
MNLICIFMSLDWWDKQSEAHTNTTHIWSKKKKRKYHKTHTTYNIISTFSHTHIRDFTKRKVQILLVIAARASHMQNSQVNCWERASFLTHEISWSTAIYVCFKQRGWFYHIIYMYSNFFHFLFLVVNKHIFTDLFERRMLGMQGKRYKRTIYFFDSFISQSQFETQSKILQSG